MKKITAIVLSGVAALFLSACGGGSSSSTPTYSTIQDLEFKTLNMAETWNVNGQVLYTTMKFTNNYAYTSDGTPALIDDTNSAYHVKLCSEAPPGGVDINGVELKYLCVGVYGSGSVQAWGLAIDNSGIISGNFHFSSSGDIYAVGAAVISPSTAYAIVTGSVSTTVATSNLTIASADGVGSVSGISESNIDDDINQEKLYSDAASDTPEKTATEQASPEIIQSINELKEALFQVQSEQ